MLCTTCAKINIPSYFTQETSIHRDKFNFIQPSSSAFNLGSLQKVYSKRKSCAFCHLVIEAVTHRGSRREWHTPEWFLELSETWEFGKKCLLYSYEYARNERGIGEGLDKDREKRVEEQRGVRMAIGLQPKPGVGRDYVHHAGEIQLAAHCLPTTEKAPMTFFGREMNPERVDVELAKRWLKICECEHGRTCEVPALDSATAIPDQHPEDLLIIDVEEMRLRRLPAGARYLALSYCWPTNASTSFQTTKAVYEELLKPRSLEKRMQELGSIIQDAISFVREFGERYLWIDALCIVQDDYEYKLKQIRQMDLVYGAAVMTIICAHPQPLDETYLGLDGFRIGKSEKEFHGLRGYRSGSRICPQSKEVINGLTLMVPFPSVDMAVRYSRWDNRAWTFQEHRLSRRKLFFTELQLYFQCSCAVFSEDTVGEERAADATIYAHSTLWNPCGMGARLAGSPQSSTWLSRSPPLHSIEAITTYKRLFDQYSRRNMTNPGDVVYAFQGITAVLSRTLQTEFIAGLPERFFHEGLLWMNYGVHSRRVVEDKDKKLVTPYPSWTWAGWDSPSIYAYVFEGLVYGEVDWFIIDDEAGPVKLNTPGAYDEMFDPFDAEKKEIGAGELPSEFAASLRPREQLMLSDAHWSPSQRLACWTTVADFEMSGDTFPLNGYGGDAFENAWNVIIFDKRGVPAGSIVLSAEAVVPMVEEQNTFEFMLLSRSHQPTPYLTFFDDTIYPKRGWCYINVMLVERKDDVATRIGVGVIHEDAWIAAKPKPMLMTLH